MNWFFSWWSKYQLWWSSLSQSERWQWLTVWLASILGVAYRFTNLRENMQFLADQGRDAIIAYEILHGNFTLVGPSTSVGSMFLGPLYYYFMAPWIGLFRGDPVGPAYAVAAIGALTVPAMFWVGKRLIGNTPAFLATLLYSFAPVVLVFTRFSWNPNPAPMVSLVILYACWQAWQSKAWWWLVAIGGWLMIIQLHYVALLMAAPIGIFYLADLKRSYQANSIRTRNLLLLIPTGLVLFLVSIAPLILFDFRFDHLIWKGFQEFFVQSDKTVHVNSWQQISSIWREQHGRGMHLLFEIWGEEWSVWYREINTVLLLIYLVTLSLGWWSYKSSSKAVGYLLLVVTTVFSILGLSFYRSSVFDHYIAYFFPVSYLLTGLVISLWVRWHKWLGIGAAALLLGYITWLQIQPRQMEYLKPLGWQVDDKQRMAQFVLDEVPAEATYAMAALTETRDYRGLDYRYFLEVSDHPPVAPEIFSDSDYLVVLVEIDQTEQEVFNSPVYEIAAYPKGDFRVVDPPGPGPRIFIIARQ